MRENIVQIIYKENPVLLEKVIQDLQKALNTKLSWLNYAFGRAYKLVQHTDDGGKFTYPAVYNGHGEYLSVMPNDKFGNFSWFDIYDPQEVQTTIQSRPQITFEGALIFWYNLDLIYEDDSVSHTEEIKDEVLTLLTTPGLLTSNSHFNVKRVYERYENVYKDYMIEKIYNSNSYKGEGIQSIDKQFFMHPYACLRVEFSLTTRESCQRYIK